jgi:geranylgeranyl diphosphate synthase type II
MTHQAFNAHLSEMRTLVDTALAEIVQNSSWPESLNAAVEYSLMAGGKRLRPVLVLLASEVCGGRVQDALPAACAIEMVHTYSLIHDDLPCMDDDDFRRGRPTSHKVFGEALAVLAGDCLLTLAFETIAGTPLEGSGMAELTRILALSAGGGGMVGGQVLDLEAERGSFLLPENGRQKRGTGQISGCEPTAIAVGQREKTKSVVDASGEENRVLEKTGADESNQTDESRVGELSQIHRMKTGALIAGALELGAVCASADLASRNQLRHYGHCIGLAFQIADDLLDVTGEEAKLGKKPGRDVDLGKLTYPSLLGIDNSRSKAEQLVQEACQAVSHFGDRGLWLKDLARFIVERDH